MKRKKLMILGAGKNEVPAVLRAKERGLEPLALCIFEQQGGVDPEKEAAAFVDAEKGVADPQAALADYGQALGGAVR
jgi:transcriptional accessory protein Tex/SPT6